MKKILMTGGHAATTAIALINEIKKEKVDRSLFWVGPESAVEGKHVPTLAMQIMPTLGVKFIPIMAGRLQKKFTVWTIPAILKIPVGFFQAFKIINNIKPNIIISFGGYASLPICFAAFVMRIPIIIHEQTVAAGRANKLNAIFAKKVLIARESSREYFPISKTVLIGNPVSADILKIKPKIKKGNAATLYITGGSSGAQKINSAISEILYELLQNYRVIHQTGKLDYDKFLKLKNNFPTDLNKKYEVYDFIDPRDVAKIFERADIIISRAGANTISEITVVKRPAILIPIPWTAYNEQTKNAESLAKSGLAVTLPESELNGNTLLGKIDFVDKNWYKMATKSDESIFEIDKNAARKFLAEINKLLA